MRTSPDRRSWRLPVLALALALASVACVDGYPSRDNPHVSALTSGDHIRALNTQLQAFPGQQDTLLTLRTPCEIDRASSGAQAPATETIFLRFLDVELAALDGNRGYQVTLRHRGHSTEERLTDFMTDSWFDAVALRSHLQQLQSNCIEDSEDDSFRAADGRAAALATH